MARRRCLRLTAVACGALCLLTVSLWVISYSYWPRVGYFWNVDGGGGQRGVILEAMDGRVRVERWRCAEPGTWSTGFYSAWVRLPGPPRLGVRDLFRWFELTQWTKQALAWYEIISVPAWLPSVLLAAPAVVGARAAMRKRVRERRGLCSRCGYDLRATPERCPECGWVCGRGE